MEGVYVLHYDDELLNASPSITNGFGGPIHYVGRSSNVGRRISRHAKGHGASKTRKFLEQGTDFCETVLDLPNTDEWEKCVTDNVTRYCGVCLIAQASLFLGELSG